MNNRLISIVRKEFIQLWRDKANAGHDPGIPAHPVIHFELYFYN